MAKYGYRQVITKTLVIGAITACSWVGTASATADPSPFSGLSCSGAVKPQPAGLAASAELNRGIRDGLAAS